MKAAETGNIAAWLTLHLASGLGPATCFRLLEHFGSPEALLRAPVDALDAVAGIRTTAAAALAPALRPELENRAANELEQCRTRQIRIIPFDHQHYPARLRNIPTPPLLLYVLGDPAHLALPGIALVGSRAATAYGRKVAAGMSSGLAREGFTIISGLALGIDTVAHRAALDAGAVTIGVLACGLDTIYPPSNRQLFQEISEHGALVSEYPLGTRPDSFRFPNRNRIISGLSLGVVVVEATKNSGSLITAEHALEQNREVFAIPGQIDSVKSAGSHRLLQQGAKLVLSVADIIEELPGSARPVGGQEPAGPVGASRRPEQLTPDEMKLLGVLEVYPQHIDDIADSTALPPQRVNELLLMLELKGAVESLPGNCYKRV